MTNNLVKYITAIIIGSVVGLVGGFQGIAGGFYISMLLIASGMIASQRKAAGTTLLAILFPISIGAVYEYWKSDDIDIPIALLIAFFYIIFAWVGAKMNFLVHEKYVVLSLALLLFSTSLFFFHNFYKLLYKK